jgi:hypothetical protein
LGVTLKAWKGDRRLAREATCYSTCYSIAADSSGAVGLHRDVTSPCQGEGRGFESRRPLDPHTLWHAFMTAALDAGVSLRDVQEAPVTPIRERPCVTTDSGQAPRPRHLHGGHLRPGAARLLDDSTAVGRRCAVDRAMTVRRHTSASQPAAMPLLRGAVRERATLRIPRHGWRARESEIVRRPRVLTRRG